MRGLGLSTDASSRAGQTRREALTLELAEHMTRDSNRVPDELFERLHAAFTDPKLVEVTFLVGFITMLNRFNNALQVRYNGEFRPVQVR